VSIVSELASKSENGVPTTNVIKEMYEEGFDPGKAEETIENAVDRGELYKPEEGKLRPT
jgi:DNA replicative helicase MCM subunit Mcm2 (Cdc46/Mcm family)